MRLNNLGIVRTNIERPDPADVKRLSQFGVATIHEAMGRVGLLRRMTPDGEGQTRGRRTVATVKSDAPVRESRASL